MSKHTELPRMKGKRKKALGSSMYRWRIYMYIHIYVCILIFSLFFPSLYTISFSLSIFWWHFHLLLKRVPWSDRNPAAGRMFSCFFFSLSSFFSVRLLCVYASASADVFQMRPNHLATRVLSPQKKLGDAYRHGRSGGNFRWGDWTKILERVFHLRTCCWLTTNETQEISCVGRSPCCHRIDGALLK